MPAQFCTPPLSADAQITAQGFAWLPLAAVKPWRKNPRKNQRAVAPVAASIRRFGFIAPVVIWPEGDRMVAGHTRIKALESLLAADPGFVPRDAPGPGMVPVRFVSFSSDTEAEAYAIADNKLGEIATWDEAPLAEILAGIHAQEPDLALLTGHSEQELAKMLGQLGGDGEASGTGGDPGDDRYREQYAVMAVCRDECHQRVVYEQLTGLGLECRVVVT